MISVFCPGNKLTKFGRRVARLASFDRLRNQRLNAGDLRKVGERTHFDKLSTSNAARRDESAGEWRGIFGTGHLQRRT